MSVIEAGKFLCDACGKTYTWKPHFAGRKLKCACGHLMHAPAAAPAAAPAMPQQDDLLYDVSADAPPSQDSQAPTPAATCPACGASVAPTALLCIGCGFNLKTGGAVGTKKAKRRPSKKGCKAAPASRAQVLGYQGTGKSPEREAPDSDRKAMLKDLCVPAAAIVVGLLLSYVNALGHEGTGFISATVYVAITTIINVVLIFIGMHIGIRLLSLSLGTPLQAVIKICGAAILPASIAGLIASKVGMGGDYIGWFASLVTTYILLMVFFEMDLNEVMMCTAIMWVLQNFLAAFLIIAILRGAGLGALAGGNPFGAFGGWGDNDGVPSIIDDEESEAPSSDELDEEDDEDDDL